MSYYWITPIFLRKITGIITAGLRFRRSEEIGENVSCMDMVTAFVIWGYSTSPAEYLEHYRTHPRRWPEARGVLST